MKATEYESEPVRGLPAELPAGETILWQGAPTWRSLARRVFHVRKVAIYFGLLALWRVGAALADGATVADAAGSALWLVPPALVAIGLLVLLAWLTARTTVYTITSSRVVMRYGIAFPACVNVPFKVIASADLKQYADGTGEIPMALKGPDTVAYFYLWPHARPWRLRKPEPMLRGVPDASRVAGILSGALSAAVSGPSKAAGEAHLALPPGKPFIAAAA